MMDAGWQYGSLKTSGEAPEPEPAGEDVGRLLDEAEDIVNAAAPDILAEFDRTKGKSPKKRLGRRKKRK